MLHIILETNDPDAARNSSGRVTLYLLCIWVFLQISPSKHFFMVHRFLQRLFTRHSFDKVPVFNAKMITRSLISTMKINVCLLFNSFAHYVTAVYFSHVFRLSFYGIFFTKMKFAVTKTHLDHKRIVFRFCFKWLTNSSCGWLGSAVNCPHHSLFEYILHLCYALNFYFPR